MADQTRAARRKKQPHWGWTVAVIVVFLAVVIALWWVFGFQWFYTFKGENASQAAANFGDSFGFVNSLFSGLALVGVIIAILLQGHELRLQREELEATREELERTADAQTQLVRLNGLANLTQAYSDEYRRKESQMNMDYINKLKHHQDLVSETIPYKLSVCTFLLEGIYATESKQPIGERTLSTVEERRRDLWKLELAGMIQNKILWDANKPSLFTTDLPFDELEKLKREIRLYCTRVETGVKELLIYVDAIGERSGDAKTAIAGVTNWIAHIRVFIDSNTSSNLIGSTDGLFSMIDEMATKLFPEGLVVKSTNVLRLLN
jgi:hypothetical protein